MPEAGPAAATAPGPSPVRGRDRFRRVRPALLALSAALRLLPAGARVLLWGLVDGWPGLLGVGLRYCLLRALARGCGDNVLVGPYVEIRNWQGLVVGSNVSIHRDCYIDAIGGVTIGDDVSIAHATSILSFDHTWEDAGRPIRDNPVRLAPVVLERDVWIGCGCRLLAGVRVGTRSVVAAGAVVNRDLPPGHVAGGVPARPLKRIAGGPA